MGEDLFNMGFLCVAVFAMAVVNLVLCKKTFGRALVGITWHFEEEFKLVYDIEPDPFVPKQVNSNCFWVSLVADVLFWVIMTLQHIMNRENNHWLRGLFSMLIMTVHTINFIIFFKAQQVASKQTAEAVRQVLLGQNTAFPDAAEVGDDSDDSEDEEESEKEEIV